MCDDCFLSGFKRTTRANLATGGVVHVFVLGRALRALKRASTTDYCSCSLRRSRVISTHATIGLSLNQGVLDSGAVAV